MNHQNTKNNINLNFKFIILKNLMILNKNMHSLKKHNSMKPENTPNWDSRLNLD